MQVISTKMTCYILRQLDAILQCHLYITELFYPPTLALHELSNEILLLCPPGNYPAIYVAVTHSHIVLLLCKTHLSSLTVQVASYSAEQTQEHLVPEQIIDIVRRQDGVTPHITLLSCVQVPRKGDCQGTGFQCTWETWRVYRDAVFSYPLQVHHKRTRTVLFLHELVDRDQRPICVSSYPYIQTCMY